MIQVAFATESGFYDTEILRVLVEKLLRTAVSAWQPSDDPIRFSGWKSVVSLGPALIARAEKAGVKRALLSIDNDGGSRRAPPHPALSPGAGERRMDTSLRRTSPPPIRCRACSLDQTNATPRHTAHATRHTPHASDE